jgi:hypothetical protein
MPDTFIHRDVTFDVTRRYDDEFEIVIRIGDRSIRSLVRTRLPELARRRAEMLIDRKLKELERPH